MNIILKTDAQIAQIKENGRILRNIVNEVADFTKPGHSTADLNKFIERSLLKEGALPTFKGYHGFPAAACISVNEVLVHGIPTKSRKIKYGDVISIDIGVTKNRCIADSCYTYSVGKISKEHKELIDIAKQATMLGVSMCTAGTRLHDIAKAVYEFVDSTDSFTIAEGLFGHGTGIHLHEPPTVSFTYPLREGIPNVKLTDKMVITIEPVICFKSTEGKYKTLKDGWTLVSLDNSFGAQFEHTVAISGSTPDILTGTFKEQEIEV